MAEGEQLLDQIHNPHARRRVARLLFSAYLFALGDEGGARAMHEELVALGDEEATSGTLASILGEVGGAEARPGAEPVLDIAGARSSGGLTVSAYPNPFSGAASIRFNLPESGPVALRVYDVLGRDVVSLVDELREAGVHEVVLDGQRLPSGVYVWRLETAQERKTGRLTLLR